MAKAKLDKIEETEEKKTLSPNEQLKAILKANKDDHFNFEEDHEYRIRNSSLLLTAELAGGMGPGAHRFVGITVGGKSSCALDFIYHFLNDATAKKRRRGVYIKAEGRLSKEVQARSGVKFTKDFETWEDGTCFILESNIYEIVFQLKRELISNNLDEIEYFFITDSADGLIKRDDLKKKEEESQTVGGGSLITSTFLKKVGLAMAKRGHIDIYISQVRDQIKINQYEVTIPKQGKSSGPRALEHQADIALEFLPRYGGDDILEGGKGSKKIGHWCKVRVLKSNGEKNGTEIKYPIRYNQTNNNSVWVAYELVDVMIAFAVLKPGGAWLTFDEDFRKTMIEDSGLEVPEKINGIQKTREWIESDIKIQEYLFNCLKHLCF